MLVNSTHKTSFWIVLILSVILLSIGTTTAQVDDLTVRFIKIHQDKVHVQMMEGVAGNPWQYRILSDWMIGQWFGLMDELGIPVSRVAVFIAFRFVQCLLILLAAGIYYRNLGLSLPANLLGLSILGWGMSLSLYNSDLAFSNFFDIAFYLAAASLVMNGRFMWIPPLMVLAAFNRETSLLIPFMMICHVYLQEEGAARVKPAVVSAILSLILFFAIFFGLRNHYVEQQFLTADGYFPGIGLLALNVSRPATWEQLLVTFGVIPMLAVFSYHRLPRVLKTFLWVVAPLWISAHFFSALVAETRLLLVPHALVFIPAALIGMTENTDSDKS